MSLDHGLQTCPTLSRPSSFVATGHDAPRAFAPMALEWPVLIQVPALHPRRPATRLARRPSASASARVRANLATNGQARPRRRLRPGVKVAAWGLLASAAFSVGAWMLAGGVGVVNGVTDRLIATRVALAVTPPDVSLTVEGALGTALEAEAAVILPGYLLPDDGFEEPAHAGGR